MFIVKINCINYKNYPNQSFKAQSYKKSMDISFSESDMENGSILASILGLGATGLLLSKIKEKSLFKVGAVAAMAAVIASLATMGVITFAKIIKKMNDNNK